MIQGLDISESRVEFRLSEAPIPEGELALMETRCVLGTGCVLPRCSVMKPSHLPYATDTVIIPH